MRLAFYVAVILVTTVASLISRFAYEAVSRREAQRLLEGKEP